MPNPELRQKIENELASRQRKLSRDDSKSLTQLDADLERVQESAIKLLGLKNFDRDTKVSAEALLDRVTTTRSSLRSYADERELDKTTGYEPGDLAQRHSKLPKRDLERILKSAIRGSKGIWQPPQPEIPTSSQGLEDLVAFEQTMTELVVQVQLPKGRNVNVRGPFRGFNLKDTPVTQDTKDLWNVYEGAAEDLAKVVTAGIEQAVFEVEVRFAMNLIEDDSVVALLEEEASSIRDATNILAEVGGEALDQVELGNVQDWDQLREGAERATRTAYTVNLYARNAAAAHTWSRTTGAAGLDF